MRNSGFKPCNQSLCLLNVQLDLCACRNGIVRGQFVEPLAGNVEIRVNVRGDFQESLSIANIIEADLLAPMSVVFRLGA